MRNEKTEGEIKETISLTILAKDKILKNKFNKRSANFYSRNYKILLKEIKEGLNKCKDIGVHGLETKLLRWH